MKSFVLAGSPVWPNGDDGVGWGIHGYSDRSGVEFTGEFGGGFSSEFTGESHCSNEL